MTFLSALNHRVVLVLVSVLPGGRVFFRGGNAQASAHAAEGPEVSAVGQGRGRQKLHDVVPGDFDRRLLSSSIVGFV